MLINHQILEIERESYYENGAKMLACTNLDLRVHLASFGKH